MSRKLHSILLAAALCLAAAPLAAHSDKKVTTPADGERLTETPQMIQLVFTDPIRITVVRLVDAEGTEMPLQRGTGLEPSLEFHAVPEPLTQGSYTVQWRGLAADGHAMQGQFSFEIAD